MGLEERLKSTGPTTKQSIPSNINRLLPMRSDRRPSGIDESIQVNAEVEARTPIMAIDAPKELAKKGKVGMVELLLASAKKMTAQRVMTGPMLSLDTLEGFSIILLSWGQQVSKLFYNGDAVGASGEDS
jgi:hypothetical protein